jgi:hypothetical protein
MITKIKNVSKGLDIVKLLCIGCFTMLVFIYFYGDRKPSKLVDTEAEIVVKSCCSLKNCLILHP